MRCTVILEREEDGGYVATVPALPGCVSQGDTRDEAVRNIREAADLYIEDCIAAGDPVPTEVGREYAELTTGIHQSSCRRTFPAAPLPRLLQHPQHSVDQHRRHPHRDRDLPADVH